MVESKKPIIPSGEKKPAFPAWLNNYVSLNLKTGIRAQLFLDFACMYQCWSLQLQCSHMYLSGEILGRF